MENDLLNFGSSPNETAPIKVIGVGGGGSNAVNFMYRQGIADVGFMVCNTDAQALENSPVPLTIQLGSNTTKGRGAGNMPDLGEQAANESYEQIKDILDFNTQMVFITACLGGGTGTGAAPVIAKMAHDLGILTIAVITVPSKLEGKKRYQQALDGVAKIRDNVDSLLVIDNDKIRKIYGDLPATQAFVKADEILKTAVKGVAEIITLHGNINIDFADVETVMKGSKVFIMGTGVALGENRAINATSLALESPLLDSNDILGTKDILLKITSGADEVTISEIGEIIEYLQDKAGSDANIIWGNGNDEELKEELKITIIATGFKKNTSSLLQEDVPAEAIELDEMQQEIFISEDDLKEETEIKAENKSQPVADKTVKKESKNKKPKEKIDNWFMRQFNGFFEENSSELD